MSLQVNVEVAEAFRYFRNAVLSRIGGRVSDSVTDASDDLVSTALRRGGGLRLAWSAHAKVLELAISHGPPSGGISGWLDLYRATLTQGKLPRDGDITFEDAVAYGLDLMQAVDDG